MWNFVGRQNDLEGHMENTNGNWVSGIPAIDEMQWEVKRYACKIQK